MILGSLLGGGIGTASAAVGAPLVQFGAQGSGAGQLETNARNGAGGGLVADPDSGHIYVAEVGNDRISEFTAWGEFVEAWGWGVADGAPELQTCTDTCQAGSGGSEPGEMEQPNGLTLDNAGDVYVFERQNHRVQVFSPAGEFLRMFGGGVNQTTGEGICTRAQVAAGDICGAGSVGAGPGEFGISGFTLGNSSTAGDYIATAPDGRIVIGDAARIEEFEPSGAFAGQITFQSIHAADPGFPESGNPGALDIDPESGEAFFSFAHEGVYEPASAFRLSDSWAVEQQLPTVAADSLATAGNGSVFAADERKAGSDHDFGHVELFEVDASGVIADFCCSNFTGALALPGLATGVVSEGGARDLYVLYAPKGGRSSLAEIRGPAPDKWPPPAVAPTIEGQFASAVGERGVTLKAEINPNFWEDTTYGLEYGLGPCATGACTRVGDFAPLGSGVVKERVTTEGIELTGLSPGTTYHYRFVARSGGGPTVGGEDTFTTFAAPAPDETDCANQAFRTRTPSAALADCRAYEMVSPVDKLGGDVVVQCNISCLPARLDQSTPDGVAITYSSYRAFAGAESAGYTTQYLARRGDAGWSTQPISPPREGEGFNRLNGLDSQYRAFTEDLSSGWFLRDTEPLLAHGAVAGYSNIYRRDDTGGYEAITTVSPGGTRIEPSNYQPEVQGFSADGSRTFFVATAKLTADAAEGTNGVGQIYEAHEGTLRLVSERPNGAPAIGAASIGSQAGGPGGSPEGRAANLTNAVSEDGSRVYWSEGTSAGSGKLYVRLGSTKTYGVSTGDATFWAATPSGSEAIYTEGGQLLRYELAAKASTPLAAGVEGVMGESETLARIYFVSRESLAGGAQAGQPNLYLYEEGAPTTFVATLSPGDVEGGGLNPIAVAPWRRASRVSPDGATAVFMSRAPLTGADNVDAVSGEEDAEVFRYHVGAGLLCVSCSPTGAAPHGAVWKYGVGGYWYAAQIPGWEFQLHAPRVLSEEGDRVFFDSLEPLVPSDTNGRQDVYEWEAPGTGTCATANPHYSPTAGGCVSLISDGGAEGESEFVDASADGSDVFFATGASLVVSDPGEVDLYDARVGGGFAEPATAADGCEGEACQSPGTPPSTPAFTSESCVGPTNQKPAKPKKCPKGKVKRHGKCVKKHKRDHGKKTHHKRKHHHRKRHHAKSTHGVGGHSQRGAGR